MLFGKTAITFAYELGLRRFLYKNSSTENFAVSPNLDLQNSAEKIEFLAIQV